MIPTEQDSKKDQENSTHATEICEYPIRLFHFYNNLICIYVMCDRSGLLSL